jgi:hypothetical protein
MERHAALAAAAIALMGACASASTLAAPPLAADLRGTGFNDMKKSQFAPQYPLWSDGMAKRRWLHLPAGSAIDKSDPDRWQFPAGTRAWKEFSSAAGRNETRLIERLADGTWRYAAYVWNADGTATLAPEDGIPERGIPSRADCVACHEGAPVPILGYSAVQLETRLSPALGYLHGNCGHCHNDDALPALEMVLAARASDPLAGAQRTVSSLVGRFSRMRPRESRESLLVARMKSSDERLRMPPIGVRVPDAHGIATMERWIRTELSYLKETPQ